VKSLRSRRTPTPTRATRDPARHSPGAARVCAPPLNPFRYIRYHDVAYELDDSYNLAAMDWLDFENLIREIFEKEFRSNGGEVKITRASRDGGVDAIAFDPDPIRGGKIVIQAKRYTNTVGVSAVRDLFGTVHNEGATKGILVTTSIYGPDAYEFAKGKPLTLLNGSELLYLLQKHGHKARIDLAEAKRLEAERREPGTSL
jgi:restriction system protein